MRNPNAEANSAVWRRLYAEGKNDLRYPSDILVRLGARLFDPTRDRRIFDFGFGTGANLLHFTSLGYETHGVEISEHAIDRARTRLAAAGLSSDLRLIDPGQLLPYPDALFDVTYAWQVLYYGDRQRWISTAGELERVTKRGGLIILAVAAPGDISQVEAEPLGNHMYRSKVPDQEGCVLTIPDREELAQLLPGRRLEIGEFDFRFGATVSRHWIISYRTPTT